MLQQLSAKAQQPAVAAGGEGQPADNTAGLTASTPSERAVAQKAQTDFAGELHDLAELDAQMLQQAERENAILAADAAVLHDANGKLAKTATEVNPEEWLAAMLGQHSTQIEARDAAAQELEGDRHSSPEPGSAPLPLTEAANQLLRAAAARVQLPEQQGLPQHNVQDSAAKDLAAVFSRLNLNNLNFAPQAPHAAAPQAAAMAANAGGEAALLNDSLRNNALLADFENLKALSPANSQLSSTASPTATTLSGQTLQAPVIEQTLRLQGPEAKWGEQMLHALRDTVELQIQQRVQTATIRLDPPELGSLEVLLKHESGHLSVQISAAQADVARLLQQLSERLRHELVGQNFVQVDVEVSSDGEPGKQPQQQRRQPTGEEPLMAAAPETAPEKPGRKGRPSDVLVTV